MLDAKWIGHPATGLGTSRIRIAFSWINVNVLITDCGKLCSWYLNTQMSQFLHLCDSVPVLYYIHTNDPFCGVDEMNTRLLLPGCYRLVSRMQGRHMTIVPLEVYELSSFYPKIPKPLLTMYQTSIYVTV
jgi:hypothetical protein